MMVESVIKFDGREGNIFKFSLGSAIYKSTEFFEMTVNPICLMLISIIVSYIIVYWFIYGSFQSQNADILQFLFTKFIAALYHVLTCFYMNYKCKDFRNVHNIHDDNIRILHR